MAIARRRVFVPDPVGHALDLILDRSLSVEQPVVHAYLDRVRSRHPDASPDEVIARLDKQYRRAVMGIGAAAGGAAAMPGIGTGAAIASGMAEVAAFVSATAMYVLALAEVHDIPTHDPEVRRELVMAVLLGEGSMLAVEGGGAAVAGMGSHWSHVISQTGSRNAVRGGPTQLSRLLMLRFGARQGALMLGRALPMGIGAMVGAVGNAALATGAINSARHAFGVPPQRLPGRIIEGGAVLEGGSGGGLHRAQEPPR